MQDPKKDKKKRVTGSKKAANNNANDNNVNNLTFSKLNNNSNNLIRINKNDNNDDNNHNDNKKNDNNNIIPVRLPTPRRKDPPISHKRLPKDPLTKIPTDNHVKWVTDSKNLDREMLLIQQDLDISNKRKDQWGKEQKMVIISPRNNSNNNNNFGTRVRSYPGAANNTDLGIHDQRWNKDTELIDKLARAKPEHKPNKDHESFQNQIKNGNKNDNNNSIQIMRNNSLILRTESAIFD